MIAYISTIMFIRTSTFNTMRNGSVSDTARPSPKGDGGPVGGSPHRPCPFKIIVLLTTNTHDICNTSDNTNITNNTHIIT